MTARTLLENALFPAGAGRASHQVRSAWYAALLGNAELRPQLRVIASGEHLRTLVPSAGSWDAVAGLPEGLQEWWLAEAAAWQRRLFELAGRGLPRRLRVHLPDGRAGAVAVALFDVIEAAWWGARICREPWDLEAIAITAYETPKQLADARAAINGFWGRDPERVWTGPQRSDRLPVAWACDLAASPFRTDAHWLLDSPILGQASAHSGPERSRPEVPGDPVGEAAGRYFLLRFFGLPHFRPGEWPAAAALLAGRPVLAALGPEGSIAYELPAMLVRGVAVVASSAEVAERRMAVWRDRGYDVTCRLGVEGSEVARHEALARVEAGRAKVLFVAPEWLQDQRAIWRLRHALRKAPGGVACFAVEEADRCSEWSDRFHPAYANLPAAFRELGDAPVAVLPSSGPGAPLLGDLHSQFGIEAEPIVAGAYGPTTAPPLAMREPADYPGYKFEMNDHREQFERVARLLDRGGFASLPAFCPDLPRWDGGSDRAGRIRTWLVRLHGLGHVKGFGENATHFFVRHDLVPEEVGEAYLGRLRARACELLGGESPPEFGNAGAGDLCEALVMRALHLPWREARETALFFDRYVAPHLHRKGAIRVPKRVPDAGGKGPETERLLYRLKRLGVVRDYFAEPPGEDPSEPLRWGVAVRRFDREAFEPGLRAALGAFSLEVGMVDALLSEFHQAAPAGAPARDVVLAGLETYLKAYYAVHVSRRRRAAGTGGGGLAGEPSDLLDLITAEEWHQAAQGRERERIAPLLELDAAALAQGGQLQGCLAWFEARGRLTSLRELANERAAHPGSGAAPRVLALCAHQALGHLDAAVASAREALACAGMADVEAERSVLRMASPAVRLAVLDSGDLDGVLAVREVRRWRHDASLELGQDRAAAGELLAELRGISSSWRLAREAIGASLGPVLARLEAV